MRITSSLPIQSELNENQKNPERIATSKGQNLQNLENTKKRNEEIENELVNAEKKYNAIILNILMMPTYYPTFRKYK